MHTGCWSPALFSPVCGQVRPRPGFPCKPHMCDFFQYVCVTWFHRRDRAKSQVLQAGRLAVCQWPRAMALRWSQAAAHVPWLCNGYTAHSQQRPSQPASPRGPMPRPRQSSLTLQARGPNSSYQTTAPPGKPVGPATSMWLFGHLIPHTQTLAPRLHPCPRSRPCQCPRPAHGL